MNKLALLLALSLITLSCSHQPMVTKDPVRSGVYRWGPNTEAGNKEREVRPMLKGVSPHFEQLNIQAITLSSNTAASKRPHSDDYERCIIVKEGSMTIKLGDEQWLIGAGSVALVMPQQIHLVTNNSQSDLVYYEMKYRSNSSPDHQRGQMAGGSAIFNKDSLTYRPSTRGGGVAYFDRSTAMCERFEMHITHLNRKGPSHQPHAHEESEIILVLRGETEMTIDGMEFTASPGDFYFMEANSQHGVRNATDQPCSYFAFKWR